MSSNRIKKKTKKSKQNIVLQSSRLERQIFYFYCDPTVDSDELSLLLLFFRVSKMTHKMFIVLQVWLRTGLDEYIVLLLLLLLLETHYEIFKWPRENIFTTTTNIIYKYLVRSNFIEQYVRWANYYYFVFSSKIWIFYYIYKNVQKIFNINILVSGNRINISTAYLISRKLCVII